MGYCIHSGDCQFVIKRHNMDAALKALQVAIKKKPQGWDWVYASEIEKCKTLAEAMSKLRWPICFNKSDEDDGKSDATSIYFEGDKIGSEDEFFQVLAPFVEEGSYVEATGEDDARWRYCFRNRRMVEESAIIMWDDYKAIVNDIIDRMAETDQLPLLMKINPTLDLMLEEHLKAPKKKKRGKRA